LVGESGKTRCILDDYMLVVLLNGGYASQGPFRDVESSFS